MRCMAEKGRLIRLSPNRLTMAVSGLNVKGIPLAAHFWFEQSDTGCEGQRAFLFSYSGMYGNQESELVWVPTIGEPFDASTDGPWKRTWLREQHCEKYHDDPDKTLIVCSYSNEPWDIASAVAGDNKADGTTLIDVSGAMVGDYIDEFLLPMEMRIETELQQVGLTSQWTWSDTEENVQQPIFVEVKTNEIKVTRIVGRGDQTTAAFAATVQALCGKVCNNATPGLNPFYSSKWQLLFNGMTYRAFTDHAGVNMWECELTFMVKIVGTDGWQLIVREDRGAFDEPLNTGDSNKSLYADADLLDLFFPTG